MALAVLIVAVIADLALAALLVGVSGFIFGAGPESMHGNAVMQSGWIAMVIFCVVAPIGGFVMRAHRRPGVGALIAWLPPLLAAVALTIPAPY